MSPFIYMALRLNTETKTLSSVCECNLGLLVAEYLETHVRFTFVWLSLCNLQLLFEQN